MSTTLFFFSYFSFCLYIHKGNIEKSGEGKWLNGVGCLSDKGIILIWRSLFKFDQLHVYFVRKKVVLNFSFNLLGRERCTL